MRRPRWGFRARLAALIAGVFVLGGVALLVVQYLLTRQLLIVAFEVTLPSGCDSTADCPADVPESSLSVGVGSDEPQPVPDLVSVFSQEVLTGMFAWSIVILVIFTVLALAAAWWLSGRAFTRLATMADAAERITVGDLDQRFRLAGPSDEIRDLGDTLDTMLDRLEAGFRRQEQFIANASHELRTPLTTTRVALEIPLAQGRVPAELEPAMRRALEANVRSERIIVALLALARGRSRAGASAGAELRAVLSASLAEHRVRAAERGVELLGVGLDATDVTDVTDAPDSASTPVVGVDPELLRQAIDNLIANAILHGPAGGAVEIRLARLGDEVGLEISNDGPVLTAEEVEALTEPFNRGPQTRLSGGDEGSVRDGGPSSEAAAPGTGLGLAFVEAVAESCGGALRLAPRAGGGLVVELRLPTRLSGA